MQAQYLKLNLFQSYASGRYVKVVSSFFHTFIVVAEPRNPSHLLISCLLKFSNTCCFMNMSRCFMNMSRCFMNMSSRTNFQADMLQKLSTSTWLDRSEILRAATSKAMGAHFYSGDVKDQNTRKFHKKKKHFYATIFARRCQNGF